MRALKSLALRVLPDRPLLELKKRHYLRAIRRFSVAEAVVIRALVEPGDHVLDVGANAGWYTRLLSEMVGPTGRVWTVEPVPPTFHVLAYCVRELRLRNVQLVECALSDYAGTVAMVVPRYDDGGENFYEAEIARGDAIPAGLRRFIVRCDSVDGLFRELEQPLSFLKIDVEGHEAAVVRGARHVIARDRPALFVELLGCPEIAASPAHEVVTSLARHGYAPYWFERDRLRLREAGDPDRNYFFLNGRHLDAVKRTGIPIA